MKAPGARLVTTNYEILGGPATAVLITASAKFREANPKAFKAFYDALSEAIDTINKDKRAAAQLYLRGRQRQEEFRRRHRRDHQRQGLRLYAEAGKGAQDRAIHGEDRLDQAHARPAIGDLFFPENAALGGD